jgi:predicted flap endonuclease-1-like 5' DNA nuclease
MEPVQALAIVSLGAFVGVLITALIYVATVRPRLLEPESLSAVGALDKKLHEELIEQRVAVEKLNSALAHHTEQLALSAAGATSGEAFADLRGVLSSQTDAVKTLTGLLDEQADKLAGFDDRLSRQDDKLDRLESKLDSRLIAPSPGADQEQLTALIQAQADRLVQIGARLDEWTATRVRSDETLDEKLTGHARVLAELDRELAAQAQTVRMLDTKVNEHTTMLVTAATERREQAGLLQRILDQVGQVVPALTKAARSAPPPGQDRLTDVNGIGPVYASRLYEAGIQTFRQLAAMSPEELYALLSLPQWRMRSVDAPSWIEQAEHLASQREKVEKISRQ